LNRVVIFVDIGGGIVDHLSMSWSESWFLLILVELLTITQWIEGRGDFCWYWWNCWPSLNDLNRGVILLILVVELLTIFQWVEVRGDVCWYCWNCWPSLNEFRWEMVFVDIGGIVDHHSMSWSERWFLLILVEQKSPLT
jgi:hypothetical protein